MLHILVGNADEDVDAVIKAAKNNQRLDWIVPKGAQPNDPTLFHLPRFGFMARGVIDSKPKSVSPGRYSSLIRDVALLPVSVPIAFILENYKAWKWPRHPLRSRTSIDGEIQARLEQLLNDYQTAIAGEDWKVEPLMEGANRSIIVTAYERNPIARRECIRHYGTSCSVCGFSFGEKYGETADGYIHVHHLRAMAGRKKHSINPIKDLRPICPNCHAVIHLQNPPLSIAELKRMLKQARG